MVIAVKNSDPMDTTGSGFVSRYADFFWLLICSQADTATSPAIHYILEAVCTKPITSNDRLLASVVSASLVLPFIAHYLGIQAIEWWADMGELNICIAATFARSISNNSQPQSTEVEVTKIDKRCMLTGIIRTQTSRIIDGPAHGSETQTYSPRVLKHAPCTNPSRRRSFPGGQIMSTNPADPEPPFHNNRHASPNYPSRTRTS